MYGFRVRKAKSKWLAGKRLLHFAGNGACIMPDVKYFHISSEMKEIALVKFA